MRGLLVWLIPLLLWLPADPARAGELSELQLPPPAPGLVSLDSPPPLLLLDTSQDQPLPVPDLPIPPGRPGDRGLPPVLLPAVLASDPDSPPPPPLEPVALR
jgi:hypothetical protein